VATRLDAAQHALGLRIQELRRAQGETQETFAARVRMISGNYARIEQGRANVTLGTLVRIASGLSVELADLFAVPMAKRSKPGRPRKDST
jgi:transcriptional regulator with XRE-family HTH domain